MNNRTYLKTIIVVSNTIILFYFIFTKINIYSVIGVLSHFNLLYLLPILLLWLSFLVVVKRWQAILANIGYHIPFIKCFNIVMAAIPLASVTPSKAGGFIRAYYLKNEVPISKTIGSVLAERVFDVFSLVLFSLIGMIFYQRFELAGIALIVLFIIIGIFYITNVNLRLPIRESWAAKLQNIALSLRALTNNRKVLLIVTFYSFFIWFAAIVQTVLIFYALGIKIPFIFTMANIPIAIFIGLIPVTFGGMGTRDVAIIFLFSAYASPTELLGVGILFSVFRYWLPALVGIPFMHMEMK